MIRCQSPRISRGEVAREYRGQDSHLLDAMEALLECTGVGHEGEERVADLLRRRTGIVLHLVVP